MVWFAVNSDWSALVMRFCVKALAVSVLVDTGGIFSNFLGFRFEIYSCLFTCCYACIRFCDLSFLSVSSV